MPANRIMVVPYGGDMSVRLEGSVTPLAESRPSKTLRLLWVGQFAYWKGAHHLATALEILDRTDVTLTAVAYDRPAVDPFGRVVSGVTWLSRAGPADLGRLFATHDALVFPSLEEAFGLVCVEALYAGLPVIATRFTGAVDVMSPGVDSFVVDGGDPAALADAIRQLADSPQMVARLKRGAKSTGRQWTWERFRAGLISAIRDLENACA
jgi:glycosyltransferase involved in cell wall biosynthesis